MKLESRVIHKSQSVDLVKQHLTGLENLQHFLPESCSQWSFQDGIARFQVNGSVHIALIATTHDTLDVAYASVDGKPIPFVLGCKIEQTDSGSSTRFFVISDLSGVLAMMIKPVLSKFMEEMVDKWELEFN
jgi:hypothetical protein